MSDSHAKRLIRTVHIGEDLWMKLQHIATSAAYRCGLVRELMRDGKLDDAVRTMDAMEDYLRAGLHELFKELTAS